MNIMTTDFGISEIMMWSCVAAADVECRIWIMVVVI